MKVVGLTGSIGMGKSATARLFAEQGAAVYDADAAVHALYEVGGAAVAPLDAAFPGVAVDGRIDRTRLSARVLGDADAMARLEAVVHPLVRVAQSEFLERARRDGAPLAVLDVPLLFETGADRLMDAVVVVSAPPALQRERVLARPGMTVEKFEQILAKQMPDADKRRKADYVIDTSGGFEQAREQVRAVMAALTGERTA